MKIETEPAVALWWRAMKLRDENKAHITAGLLWTAAYQFESTGLLNYEDYKAAIWSQFQEGSFSHAVLEDADLLHIKQEVVDCITSWEGHDGDITDSDEYIGWFDYLVDRNSVKINNITLIM